MDRTAVTREAAPVPTNRQPLLARQHAGVRRAVAAAGAAAGGAEPGTDDAADAASAAKPGAGHQSRRGAGRDAVAQRRGLAVVPAGPESGRPAATSPLGQALKNLSRYAEQAAYDNPNGGATSSLGPAIQFDTKGVEFGPWIRRFIAQVKRNWFVPYAAMSLKGHVVITFNVHKNGALTDLTVIGPSSVDSFNNAAFNALATSNPTEPLPVEYPSDKAFFTVTFYYNEPPPTQ